MPESWKLLSRRDSSRVIMRVLGLSVPQVDDRSVTCFAYLRFSRTAFVACCCSQRKRLKVFPWVFGVLFSLFRSFTFSLAFRYRCNIFATDHLFQVRCPPQCRRKDDMLTLGSYFAHISTLKISVIQALRSLNLLCTKYIYLPFALHEFSHRFLSCK
jgi:hypothetical protein